MRQRHGTPRQQRRHGSRGARGYCIRRCCGTFLIDAGGVLRAEWRGIKVAGHVEDVLLAVKGLAKKAIA